MRKTFLLFIGITAFGVSCQKESEFETSMVSRADVKIEERAQQWVQYACKDRDANGNFYAGLQCKLGVGSCTQETGCIPIPIPPRSSDFEDAARDFVDAGIERGVFLESGREELIELALESLESVESLD
jgi:hypothetical protein